MVFNSLGSNYNLSFVLKSLLSFSSEKDKISLKRYLEERYGGDVVLLYKGREAIKLALELLQLPSGSKIGITGFTCYVVYQAVVDSGLTPEFIDIGKDDLDFSEKELQKHKDLKAVIIQNTLGSPCNIERISKYCQSNKIILIEDLAHSVGIKYKNGREAGTVGDLTALSFSQDKMVDAVSGGALIIRNKKYSPAIDKIEFNNLPAGNRIRDRFYPKFTYLIRSTYTIGIGKAIHAILKKLKLLSQPIPDSKGILYHDLPNWYCGLIKYQYANFERNLDHRKKIADIYKSIVINGLSGLIRFPILVKSRKELVGYLKQHNVFVSDIWYDAPIAPKRYLKNTSYYGQCKNSEFVSERILNLPTHINISESEARRVAGLIKTWQTTNHE